MTTNQTFETFFQSLSNDEALTLRGRKRTKVIATIGPASEEEDVLRRMFHAGMNVARLNMSHGDHVDHQRRFDLVRHLSRQTERPVAIMADLQGPKIRTCRLRDSKPVYLQAGQDFTITTDLWPDGDAFKVGTTYPDMHNDVRPGNTILINDGRLKLEVTALEDRDIHCRVVVGGQLSDSKGINLPGVKVSAPSLSDKDKADLVWAVENQVDYIALSFVRNALDVKHVRRRIQEMGADIPIIAKIELEDAVEDIDEILHEADAIMVARGDLGIEIRTERLPVVQKHLITRANAMGKAVITATQMLESMIDNPIPTRAESSDVANAVFDGTDAIMLSGETAVGQHPVEAVAEMNRIALEAEESPYMPRLVLDEGAFPKESFSLAMTGSADYLARTINARGIMVFSRNSRKALLLSKRRNQRLVLVMCSDESMWRRMSLYWGIVPLLVPSCADSQEHLERGINQAVRHRLLGSGDVVVALMGSENDRARTLKVVDV